MYCVNSICENVVFLLLTSSKSDENEFLKKHTPVLADATCQTTDQGPGTQSCTDLTALDDLYLFFFWKKVGYGFVSYKYLSTKEI